MTKIVWVIAALFWSTCAFAATGGAQGKRIALVIGNAVYKHAVNLPNPTSDARLMAETLRGAGFQIIEGIDLDKTAMGETIDRFTEQAYDADLALVFYAGHGLQVDGRNYLIPVDAELTSPAHLRTRAIDLETILSALPQDPSVGIVILDACRDNPLARTLAAALPASRSSSLGQGLAPVETAAGSKGAGGILIAYATDPGAVALDGKEANSPYTKALARHIATPGLEIQSALTRVRGEVTEATQGRQRPWHNASLGREVYIGGEPLMILPAETAPATAGATSAPVPGDDLAVEQRIWDEVSKRHTAAHYDIYLAQFPNGRFAAIARLNRDQLAESAETEVASLADDDAVESTLGSQVRTAVNAPEEVRREVGTPVTEAAIGLDRDGRIDLQLRLTALGHALGGVDGALGRKSREAIGGWQRETGLVETTFLTPGQHDFLVLQTEPMMAAVRAEYEANRAASAQRAKAQRAATTNRATNQRQANRNNQRKGNRGNKNDGFLGKAGAFAAGVAVGVVGCKLANC